MSRFTSHARTLTLLTALGTAALLASPAIAAAASPAADVPQVSVPYSALDLATRAGTEALYQRIARAARSVCPAYDSRDLEAFAASRECQRQAVARAVRQVGNSHLTALQARARARRG
jgi:UrcA family protein